MTTQGTFWKHVYGWGLLLGLALLWLLALNPGQSLAQTPTVPAWMNPLQSAGALHPNDYPDSCLNMVKIPDFDGGVINLWTCNSSNSQIKVGAYHFTRRRAWINRAVPESRCDIASPMMIETRNPTSEPPTTCRRLARIVATCPVTSV